MLIKQIRQQVLLVVRQSVEQRKQVRVVAQHNLRRDDRRCGRLAHNERRRIRERRNEGMLQTRQLVFEDLRGQAQRKLGECNETKCI